MRSGALQASPPNPLSIFDGEGEEVLANESKGATWQGEGKEAGRGQGLTGRGQAIAPTMDDLARHARS